MAKPTFTFPATQWLELEHWKHATNAQRRLLLEQFYIRYQQPLLSFVRNLGYLNEADDIVQDFVLQQMDGRIFSTANVGKGRFRDFLLRSLKNHLASYHRAANAQKRMPKGGFVGIADYIDTIPAGGSPDEAFEHAWIRSVIDNTLIRLAEEFADKGQGLHAEIFKARIVDPILRGTEKLSITELAASYGVTQRQASNNLVTAKRAFARHLQDEVATYAPSRKEAAMDIQGVLHYLTAQTNPA